MKNNNLTNKKINLISIYLILVLVSSCASTNNIPDNPNNSLTTNGDPTKQNTEVTSSEDTGLLVTSITLPQGMSYSSYMDVLKAYQETEGKSPIPMKELLAIMGNKNWQESDRQARLMIENSRNKPVAFLVHQHIAISILWRKLLSLEKTSQVQDAIAYYVNVLETNNAYLETKVIAQSLAKLQGYWNEEKISIIAQKSLAVAKPQFEKLRSTDTNVQEIAQMMIKAKPELYQTAESKQKLIQELQAKKKLAEDGYIKETPNPIELSRLQMDASTADFEFLSKLAARNK